MPINPANLFVAGFIGTPQINFFEAQLRKEDDEYYVFLNGIQIKLSSDKQASLKANNTPPQEIIIGVRPEHIMLCADDEKTHISGIVDVSEMMGSSVHLHVSYGEKDVVIVIHTMRLDGSMEHKFNYGEKVNFTFGGNVVHMFSKDTTENLI